MKEALVLGPFSFSQWLPGAGGGEPCESLSAVCQLPMGLGYTTSLPQHRHMRMQVCAYHSLKSLSLSECVCEVPLEEPR